jgi:uncharacterized protein with HEPN domain
LKKEQRTYKIYLDDIILAMQRIAEYIEKLNLESFIADYKTVDAVIRNFEIIGEASKNIPDSLKTKYVEVPWKEMYYLRNKVSHEYFGIDYEVIFDIAKNHLPENLLQIEKIVKSEF